MSLTVAAACLALNIYFEARDQSFAGQLAVAQVTLNRVESPRYPDSVCEVVKDRDQFSWYWDGKSDTPFNAGAWETAQLVASAALDGTRMVGLEGVTHYHALYVEPFWADPDRLVAQIGDHKFYFEIM